MRHSPRPRLSSPGPRPGMKRCFRRRARHATARCATGPPCSTRPIGSRPRPARSRWVFRDRALSDRIGFTYASWNRTTPRATSSSRCARRGSRSGGDTPGARFGDPGRGELLGTYTDDGGRSSRRSTGSRERLRSRRSRPKRPARAARRDVDPRPGGIWIRPDLGIWIGQEDKNRAWPSSRARSRHEAKRSQDARAARRWKKSTRPRRRDWFWWYGDDIPARTARFSTGCSDRA